MLSSEIQIGQIVHGCKLCPSWICSLFLAGVTVVTFTVHPPPTLPIYVFQPSSTSVGRPCCSISLDSKHSHQDRHNWPAKIEESGQRHSLAHQLSSGQSQCLPCNWWPVGHSLGPKRLRWVTDDTILPLNSRLKSAITSSPPRVETITGVTIPCFWRQVMWVIRGFSMSRTEEVCEWSESLTDTVAGVFCVAVWLQCGSTVAPPGVPDSEAAASILRMSTMHLLSTTPSRLFLRGCSMKVHFLKRPNIQIPLVTLNIARCLPAIDCP